jgi:hypothetical protein
VWLLRTHPKQVPTRHKLESVPKAEPVEPEVAARGEPVVGGVGAGGGRRAGRGAYWQ